MPNGLILPAKYSWVDTNNYQFRAALESILDDDGGNIFIQAKAGCGKSLMINIASEMKENLVVLSTTGTTAMQLSTDGVPAKTVHSFFHFPAVPLLTDNDIYKMFGENKNIIKNMETLIIDEVSMLSAQTFDWIIKKLLFIRKGDLPRVILFGDVLQLPPVISNEKIVQDYYKDKYGGKVMFFSSNAYKSLGFKMMTLNQSYRQKDETFADYIYSIGINSYDKTILDYFNSRVMSLPKYDRTHDKYIFMSPTNATVNKVNKEYIDALDSDEFKTYNAKKSSNFPAGLIEDAITIKKGCQVMATRNDLVEHRYANGMIGTAIEVQDKQVIIEFENGTISPVGISKYELKKPYLDDDGKIKYKVESWAEQIDCKVCRAMTVHKSQGKSFDNAYLALNGWTPPGIVYVGLSRLTSLNGLGLSRPIQMNDIQIFKEAMDFLTQGI